MSGSTPQELRAEATRRLAVGLDIPSQLLDSADSHDNCDSQRTIHRNAIKKATSEKGKKK